LRKTGVGVKGKKKSQAFSVDFLIAVAILAMAFGIFLNSFSQIQGSSVSTLNSSAFVLAEDYSRKLSNGENVEGCIESGQGQVTTCDFCSVGSDKFFVQRIYSSGSNAKLLRVGVCD